ncbi:MAG: DUF6765 family protein [Byssovorax sp.]
MEIDMHYYGTYALARAAGIAPRFAEIIATAAQYVDDSTDHDVIEHPAGTRFELEVTAHHPANLPANNDQDDQRQVWVPFHFLPGAEGESLVDKLTCRKDSAVAREMVAHNLSRARAPWGVELMGITAHVYADTFAHYGFSGVSSQQNRVDGDSIAVLGDDLQARELFGARLSRFFKKYGLQGGLMHDLRAAASATAEVLTDAEGHGALGHGAVATNPDQPYLKWRYTYEPFGNRSDPVTVTRDNHADFIQGAAALHGAFTELARYRPDVADAAGGRSFESITDAVADVLATVAESPGRTVAWQKAVESGAITGRAEPIPVYDEQRWRNEGRELASLARPEHALDRPLYRFYQAAALHRAYVLRELLPKHGVVII